jgi:hypothetical protein
VTVCVWGCGGGGGGGVENLDLLKLTYIVIDFRVNTRVQFHCTYKFVRIGYEGNIYTEKFQILFDFLKV